jgi:hypothetical protein
MCAAIMYYAPATGFLVCGEDDEVPVLFGGESVAGCVATDSPGNELGVGMACTKTGGECMENETASMCLAIFDPAANFCSFFGCTTDDECGSGAVCYAESGSTACIPNECADSP